MTTAAVTCVSLSIRRYPTSVQVADHEVRFDDRRPATGTGLSAATRTTTTQKIVTNIALAQLLDEAGMSKQGLARHVIAAGQDKGRSVGTTRATVNRMLQGSQPHAPVPHLVASVLSDQLGRAVTVADCGLRDTAPSLDEPYDALQVWPTLAETTRTVYELAGRDMRRRTFLRGSSLFAAAFAESALLAVTAPSTTVGSQRGGNHRLGQTDVELLTQQIQQLRRADQEFGSARTREHIVRLVHHETGRLRQASYTEQIGARVCSVLAQATALAGWTAADTDRHALAQRYFVQALELAKRGSDRLYPANLLAHMGRQTIVHGERTGARMRCGQQALALTRAGLTYAGSSATPGLRALLHATAARAHAELGDHRSAHAELTQARKDHEHTLVDNEPEWLSYTTSAEFSTDAARLLRVTGHPDDAARLLHNIRCLYPAWQTRRRAMLDLDLALTYAAAGELDHAHATGVHAAGYQHVCESAKGRGRLRELHQQLTDQRYPARDLECQILGAPSAAHARTNR